MCVLGTDGKNHFLSDLSGPEDVAYSSLLDTVIIADTGCVISFQIFTLFLWISRYEKDNFSLSLWFYIGNHRVKTYDYKSRSLLTTIGMKGTGNGQVRTFWFNTVYYGPIC